MQIAGMVPNPNSFSVGGQNFPRSLTGTMKILTGNTNTTNGFATLREVNATAGYQVPVGKNFRIVAVRLVTSDGTSYLLGSIGYGDTDVGMSAAAAPTNPVYQSGAQLASVLRAPADGMVEAVTDFVVPTGKYPFYADGSSSQAGSCQVFGYEY